jgi:hypothetical protein
MAEYTPTTEEVKNDYATFVEERTGMAWGEIEGAFDRWFQAEIDKAVASHRDPISDLEREQYKQLQGIYRRRFGKLPRPRPANYYEDKEN